MLALNVSEQAAMDIVRAYEYLYDHASERIADKFITAVDKTLAGLRRFPRIGRAYFVAGVDDTLRCWQIDGFDALLVFYRVSGQSIDVVRIEHGARDLIAMFDQLT